MTSIESRSYCRVVVIAPSTRVDLALPSDVSIIDLLPMLLQYAGENRDDGGGTHGGWKLVRVGHGELDGGRTLRSLDVTDGEVLRLAPREERAVEPVFDDVVDAIATTRRDNINARRLNPGVGAGVIVAAMLIAAFTLFQRGLNGAAVTTIDAYIAGGVAVAMLGLATAVAQGYRDRVVATATAAGGIPMTFICGLSAVQQSPTHWAPGHWGVLLGSALSFVYALVALLALGTGTVVFSAVATGALFTALSALIAGIGHLDVVRVLAGTLSVALLALSMLPRLAVRLARLPLATVPTTGEDLPDNDDLGNMGDVTARARVAGEYLTGTQIGCAVVVGFSAMVIGADLGTLAIALASVAVVALALRARHVVGLGARIALIASAALAGLFAAYLVAVSGRDGNGIVLLLVVLALVLVTLVVTTAPSRRQVSPQTMRLVDFFESGLVIAVLPLAVGVMGLYDVLRHL